MKKKLFKRLSFVIAIGCLGALVTVVACTVYITHDLPKLDNIEDYRPPLASRVYDAQGNVIAEFFVEKRTLVNVKDLPSHVRNAFIAAEDADFYNHGGVDYVGIVRAMLYELKYKLVGGQRMGGSTITQQTAKTMLLTRQRTYTRKIKEMILAHRIEEALTKDEILNLYLNQIYFGNGAYGIEEAARTYYGVSAKNLTLGQAASLASVPKSPVRLNPLKDPERVRARRDYVLEQMVIHGFASASHAHAARKEIIQVKTNPNPYLNIAPYFAEEIRRQLVEKFGEEAVFYHGLSIHTSLNSNLQRSANKAIRNGLRSVDKRQGYRGPALREDPDTAQALKDALLSRKKTIFANAQNRAYIWNLETFVPTLKASNLDEAVNTISLANLERGTIVAAVVKSVSNAEKIVTVDLGSVDGVLPMSKMTWARPFNVDKYTNPPNLPSDLVKSGDIIWVRVEDPTQRPLLSLEQEPLVGGALISLDVKTGSVLAMVGGYDYVRSSFNRATQAKRQPGSSFKPFVYSTAIDKGLVTAATLITDAPKVFFEAKEDGNWKPKNHTGRFLGDITVRTCLTRSVNTCSISLLERVGIDAVRDTAAKVGLLTERTPFPRDLTLALGSADIIPIDLVNAYRIFPNAGRYSPYVLYNKVTTQSGEILFQAPEPEYTQAIRAESAFITTNILRGLMRGIGKSVTGLTDALSGKTGTTNQMRSAWFVGFSQDMVAGVYVGMDGNQSLGPGEYGFKAALPIWGQFMSEALREIPAREFDVPDGLVWRLIDQRTGLLAGADGAAGGDDDGSSTANGDENADAAPVSRGVILEAFISGTEPKRTETASGPPPLEMMESGAIRP